MQPFDQQLTNEVTAFLEGQMEGQGLVLEAVTLEIMHRHPEIADLKLEWDGEKRLSISYSVLPGAELLIDINVVKQEPPAT